MTFEKLPREGTKAFAAFRVYLEMGPQRSLSLTAGKLGKSKAMMERWSRRHDWSGRVAAQAGYVAQVERETIESLAREKAIEWMKVHEDQRIQEWNARTRALKLADEMIKRWEANPKKCGTLEGIARLLELASKLGRLAAGMPTEIKEVNTTLTATIDVEWEIAIRKAYGVAVPETVVEVETVGNDQGPMTNDLGGKA